MNKQVEEQSFTLNHGSDMGKKDCRHDKATCTNMDERSRYGRKEQIYIV